MVFKRKKETTEAKVARTAGGLAGKTVRAGRKTAAAAAKARRSTRRAVGQVTAAVSRARTKARRAAARRKVRKTLRGAGRKLKSAGKAAAIVGLGTAAAATAATIAGRRRG